jgi:hypothetical protein
VSLGYHVTLPKSVKPKFPAACVECSAPPTTTLRIASESTGWWAFFPGMYLYALLTGRTIQVPACDACIRQLRRERRLRKLVGWVFIIAGIAVGMWLFHDWTGLARRFAIITVTVVIALPYIAWEVFFPPAVDITVTDNNVEYTFRRQDYADRFATENAIISS